MNQPPPPGQAIRHADAPALAQALRASRHDTLALFGLGQAACGGVVPQRPELNPPLWELGHIGWFQAWWLARNPQRNRGAAADPDVLRPADAGDALYDSSRVPHDSRWALPLPGADATRAQLHDQLQQTLALLHDAPAGDDALYFFRLALLHEDMHHEAGLTMAQALGLPVADARWQPPPLAEANPALVFDAGPWLLGHSGPGFVFDNELGAHGVVLPASQIDSRVQRWADFLPFVEAGGYDQPRWWSAVGNAWRARHLADVGPQPRHLRRHAGAWQQNRWGQWQALNPALPANHLSFFEAEAWCAWAGRRLPTEAEWERAAITQPGAFDWGAVWEWTASPFTAYPGFVAHPYRDYSAPWFGSRQVLRGASFATQPRMQHPRYRNFFSPERTDIFAGLRSCAV